jgi:hypothetical protein
MKFVITILTLALIAFPAQGQVGNQNSAGR